MGLQPEGQVPWHRDGVLVAWRERLAAERRKSFRHERYWGRPIPGWGSAEPRVLIVAPLLGHLVLAFPAKALLPPLQPARLQRNSLQRFEARLGTSLFRRTTWAVCLREDGETYLEAARAALRRLNEAEVALAVRGDELVGRVRVISRSVHKT